MRRPRPPEPSPRTPPSDEDVARSMEDLRTGLRRNAEIFYRVATIAADGGELQRTARAMGEVIVHAADAMDMETLDAKDNPTARDTVAIAVLNMTLAAGTQNYGSVSRTLEMILKDTT